MTRRLGALSRRMIDAVLWPNGTPPKQVVMTLRARRRRRPINCAVGGTE